MGGGATISENNLIYSIQRTYIINRVPTSNAFALTCNQRIDVPVIEPLADVRVVVWDKGPRTVVPCVELKMGGISLEGINLVFETNEGATVLPVKIDSGSPGLLGNPYLDERFVLALPRGTTGIKSCKVSLGENGESIQHNFTFGLMPPPYNYDNALFGCLSYRVEDNSYKIETLEDRVNTLKLKTKTPIFEPIDLPKGAGKQTINIKDGVLFYNISFMYHSLDPTPHKPKITLHIGGLDFVYTLSLNKTSNGVLIDLFTGKITVCDGDTNEIIQQFLILKPYNGFETLSFENFDDINSISLQVEPMGAYVE